MERAVKKRILVWVPVLAVLIAAVTWLLRPQPVTVDLGMVESGPLQVTVSDEGETRVRDMFVVSAPVPGLMRRVELEAGDTVIGNKTVIARIEPTNPTLLDQRATLEARAAVDAAAAASSYAEAQIRRAQAEADFATVDLERISALAERHTVSRSDLDAAARRSRTANAALQEAQAALRMRESELRQARARLTGPARSRSQQQDCECVRVFSPISGTIMRVVNESEGVVQSGAPIVEIGDPRRLEVQVDLLSEDAVRVEPGQRVIVDAWGGPAPLAGVVRRVEPFGHTKVSALGIEEQRVNVIIYLTEPYERWARLGHGYRVEPRIVLWESDRVLRVPLSALFREGQRWAVFVERRGRAVLTFVDLGQQNSNYAQVVAGLMGGERIVLHPNDRVASGVRIVARRTS